MSNEQVTKNQHFVPQFYLRKFLNANREVEILDCDRRSIITPRGTKGICSEDFFYAAKTGEFDELSQYIETSFQQLEDNIARNIDAVIAKILGNKQILDDEKWLIAQLMSMLWIRGPMIRKQINASQENLLKQMNAFKFSHPNADQWLDMFDEETGSTTTPEMRGKVKELMIGKDYSLEFNNAQHLLMFESINNFANLFHGQDWNVYLSKSHKKFVTSDNPVAVVFPERKGFYGPTFLERTHYFSLTPDILVQARYPNKNFGKKLRRKTLLPGYQTNEWTILMLNMIISGQANDFAYSTERQSLEDILEEASRQASNSRLVV